MGWSPSKQHNFVCTLCRRSVRRHANSLVRGGDVRCATCGDLCEDIGAKRPVPKRSDAKGWQQLQDDLNPPRANRIAELERRLAAYESEASAATAAWRQANAASDAAWKEESERQLALLRKLHRNRTGSEPPPDYQPPSRRGADRAARAEAAAESTNDA